MLQKVEYKQLSDIEHVLIRHDMYTGKVQNVTNTQFTYYPKSNRVKYEEVTYNCGVLKLFDEVFTNAIDNVERKSNITTIDINIDESTISVRNDGKNTIEIRKCDKPNDNIYIPELIFTRLRSGSNFDDTVERTYGGRNGIGSKLASIFSKCFIIDICHNGKRYYQEVYDNCSNIKPPVITNIDSKDYVEITFEPDFKRFDCESITKDTYKVLCKRVHDCSHLGVKLSINGYRLPKQTWDQYVCSYPAMTSEADSIVTYVDTKSRWKIALTTSSKTMQTSTVNYVNTINGGTHVKYILEQVRDYINNNIKPTVKLTTKSKTKGKNKDKDNNAKSNYTTAQIASHMFVIISAIIVNPEFVDQAKTELTTNTNNFKNACIIPESQLELLVNSTNIINELESKAKTKLLNGARKNINAIEKYIKANKANPKEGYNCTLFICEGLSAKTMCVAGMNIIGYDYYGVYPLRGKVLNTRNASLNKFCENREIQDLISIMGLENGKEYTSTKGLNYGKIVCMKDADSDGADIMGLVMNFFEHNFKSLVSIKGFFNEFITPMIQVINGKQTFDFYNEVQYKQFIASKEFKDARVRFIKGLASNTKTDIDKYFNNYDDNMINILFDNDFEESLDKAFNKDRADDRKIWMTTITPDTHLPRTSKVPIHVDDFINNELVLYSMDACIRAIPSVIDGLKPVQRKILYTLFNNTSTHSAKEIKVVQLCGDVMKFANYHHGDQSLNAAIIKMAQTYPGSNNIALVENSSDGFGTRQENGNDCGQPRYLTVKSKASIARLIFPEVDDNVIVNRVVDNETVEPIYYIPIIPMVLINGATGIGMGWSTTIPLHSVQDCIQYVRDRLDNNSKTHVIHTYYNDYDGIIEETPKYYKHTGKLTIKNGVVRVTEIPINMSISNFRDIVVKTLMLNDGETIEVTTDSGAKTTKSNKTSYHIASYKSNVAKNINHIDIELTFDRYPRGGLTVDALLDVLQLKCNIATTNMVAFNKEETITLYKTTHDIAKEWFDVRYDCYVKRKVFLIKQLENLIKLLQNKVKFVKENIDETLDYKNKDDAETDEILISHNYDKLCVGKQTEPSFDYLLSMQVRSFTKDKYDKLCKELEKAIEDYEILKKTSEADMWHNDLDKLEKAL